MTMETSFGFGGKGLGRLPDRRLAVVTRERLLVAFDADWPLRAVVAGSWGDWGEPAATAPRPLGWHQGEVTTFAVQPNGHLAVGCSDGAVRVVDPEHALRQGEQVARADVQTVGLLTDGALVVATSDGTVQIREKEQRSEVVTLLGNPAPVLSRFPNRSLGSGGSERDVRVVAFPKESVRPLAGSIAFVHDLASLDGGLLIANQDGTQVWPPEFNTPMILPSPSGVEVLEPLGEGRFAAGCEDGVVRVWEIRKKLLLAELPGHGANIVSLHWSPPCSLVSADSEGCVWLWNLNDSTGRVLANHQGWVYALAKSGENYIVSAGQDSRLRFSPIDGRSREQVLDCAARVTTMKRLPDGRLILGDAEGLVWIVNVHDETLEETVLYRHPAQVELLDVMSDGRVVSADDEGLVKVWDLRSHQGWVLRVAMSRPKALEALEGGRVAIAGSEGLRVWRVDQDELCLTRDPSCINHMQLLPNGDLALAISLGKVGLCDLREAQNAAPLRLPAPLVHCIRELPDRQIALGLSDGTVQVFDRSGNRLEVLEDNANAVRDLIMSHNGWLVTATSSKVAFWNLEKKRGGQIHEPASFLAERSCSTLLYAWRNCVGVFDWGTSTYQCVTVPEAEAEVLTLLKQLPVLGTERGEVRLREGDDGICQVLEGHEGPVRALIALSAECIVSAGDDKSVRFWRLQGDAEPSVGREDSEAVLGLARLPTGGLASASYDGSVRVWKEDGTHGRLLGMQPGWARCLQPLSGGRLASAGKDGAVRVWDIRGVTAPHVLDGHQDAILILCRFSDDLLLSAGRDGRILCWDLTPSGYTRLREFAGHKGWVHAIVPINERWFASAGSDDTVRLWTIDGEETHVLEVGYIATMLQLLPDGRLACGTSGEGVQVWDLHRRECDDYLYGGGSFVTEMTLLQDRHLVAATKDGLVTVHGLNGVGEKHRLNGHRGEVTALATLAGPRIV
jgi:WD40 repeat protein